VLASAFLDATRVRRGHRVARDRQRIVGTSSGELNGTRRFDVRNPRDQQVGEISSASPSGAARANGAGATALPPQARDARGLTGILSLDT
jgi:hypothetical protein